MPESHAIIKIIATNSTKFTSPKSTPTANLENTPSSPLFRFRANKTVTGYILPKIRASQLTENDYRVTIKCPIQVVLDLTSNMGSRHASMPTNVSRAAFPLNCQKKISPTSVMGGLNILAFPRPPAPYMRTEGENHLLLKGVPK